MRVQDGVWDAGRERRDDNDLALCLMTERRGFWPRLVFSSSDKPREALIAQDGADQADRFRRVMLPHLDAAYSYARYLTRDPHEAEDVVQDAFLRAFRSFHTWRGDAARAWLFSIVRNCFLSTVADQPGLSEDVDLIDLDHPHVLLEGRDEAAMLRQTIADLPQPFRETLILRELEELSYKEIALITGVPIGTVMSRLARARGMLAELLLPDAPSAEDRP